MCILWKGGDHLATQPEQFQITEIEKEIINMISQECSNSHIAEELNYSKRMIEYYIRGIANKLSVQTRVGIVTKSFKEKIL